ncbi:hypothetical protein KGF56_004719 [Candida oxycetoniae]|uniref:Uncharacterized protein n=1 Tax=Candida oxycetoniae TaxID=497107 RepID=A0AAI9SST2_9ASCO|nr:uncharacterized protein KGF56_004719 [Candida oxycetoniae]KAI3402478.2 hypothetical protein KGF56_004719 [Candida oxycetoniae]
MDAASCGPSSALQNLNKHTQRDTSLQHQRITGQSQQHGIHQFRQGHNIDSKLNQEFQNFNQDAGGNDFAGQFIGMNRPLLQTNVPHALQQQHQQRGWIQDFSKMSIDQGQQPMQQQQHVQSQRIQNDWSGQFAQPGGLSLQQQPQPQQVAQPNRQFQVNPSYSLGRIQNTGGLYMNPAVAAPVSVPQFNQQSEHQQAHKFEDQQKQFENEFDAIEKELQSESQVQRDDSGKDIFAEAARKIEKTMNSFNTNDSEMANKFQNSEFLKLMSSIGGKKVELQDNKLVNVENQQDIREQQDSLDSMPHESSSSTVNQGKFQNSSSIDYHEPIHNHDHHHHFDNDEWSSEQIPNLPLPSGISSKQQKLEKESQPPIQQQEENRLPDPLAHISVGQLEGITDPLAAARIISGGQVQTRDWVDGDDDWLTQDMPTLASRPRPWRKGQIVDHHWDEMYRDYRHDDDYN